MARPPFARDAIRNLPDGNVRIHFKQPTARGSTYVDISRDIFLARLAALIPSPGFNMIRYYGALANGHHCNQAIRPHTPTPEITSQLNLFEVAAKQALSFWPQNTPTANTRIDHAPRRLSWAKLLARVFHIDINVCTKCGGPIRVLEALTEPAKIAAVLHGARPPPRPPPPGQILLFDG